ncbi:MAG: hypothetical protein IKE45_09545 [Halomonas sp.]|nr:hypothetical protein [Halomonas sp.]MBR2514253.1 hypothetical protein [Halomonas sp.]
MTLRQLFAPALLAVALTPLAFTAQAGHHEGHEGRGYDREQMVERMEERHQEVFQRAELSEEQQEALNEAHAEHREALKALHEEHHARVAGILSEEEQQAVREAMREVHEEYRRERGHGKRGYHHDKSEAGNTAE